jgi:tetratricopeptide (TPR) repeat protein
LVTGIVQPQKPDAATPFQYFGTQFHPAAGHVVVSRLPLRVLYQLESPEGAQDLEVEYLLAHSQNREARKTVFDSLKAAQFRNGRLITSKAIPLEGLPDGEYRVVLTVKRPGSAESLASVNVALRLDSSASDAVLYFDPNVRQMNQPGVAAYIRALCALSQGMPDLATTYLRQSVDQNPSNVLAASQLMRSYFEAKRYSDVAAMYNKLGEKPFENSVESLAQLSLSLWNTGQQQGARAVLSDARQAFPEDPLVAAVAKTVR